MTWFKVDDHLHSHRKAMRAGTEAMGLWVLAGSWSAAEESDGWVPSYVLPRLVGANGAELAERLEAAGLWHADVVDGEDGYRFHAWDEYQPTKAQLDKRREDTRERMRRARSHGGDVRAHNERSEGAVTPTPTRPDPTPTDTPSRKRDAQSPADKAGDDFDRFWQLYPNRVGKQDAARAWTKAIKHADVPTIAAGLRNALDVWIAEGRVRMKDGRPVTALREHYVPNPATWLNQGRWDDEQLTAIPNDPAGNVLSGQQSVRPPTAAQCGRDDCPGVRHEWTKGSNRFICMGRDE